MWHKAVEAYDQLAEIVSRIKLIDLVAFLSAYALLRVSHNTFDFVTTVFVSALMLKSSWRRCHWLWFGIVLVWLPRVLLNTYQYEDHVYLVIYWCAAVALALWGTCQEEFLRRSARLLIGLSFGFAFFWKIISPEFYDGSLFHFKLLFDYRFAEMVTGPIGGLASSAGEANLEAYRSLRQFDQTANSVSIAFPPRVTWIAHAMTVWTIVVEGLLAAAFLLPGRAASALTNRGRDALLIFFMLSTYFVVPVLGFASIFTAMGVAQCEPNSRWRVAYLLISLVLFAWYTVRWQVIA